MSASTELLPKKLLEQLQAVKCHLLGSREESWLREVLFSTADIHYEFLKWILYSFDENLGQTLKNADFSSLSLGEKQKHLHTICYSLGICGTDDLNLINGSAKKEALIEFWELLLSLHLTHVKKLQGSGEQSELQLTINLSGIRKLDNSDYSDTTEDLKASAEMSTQAWKLLPPDLEHEVKVYTKVHSLKTPTKEELLEMVSSKELSLKGNGCLEQGSNVSQEKTKDLHEQVISSMHSLQEMASGFQDCHQRLEPWLKTNFTKPGAKKLEELVKTSAEKMAQLQKMLDDMDFESGNRDLTESIINDKKALAYESTDNSIVLKTLKDSLNTAQ